MLRVILGALICTAGAPLGIHAQPSPASGDDAIRVTVSINEDGSRTSYEFDSADRKAVATTSSAAGKVLSKIRYQLDDAGRFASGEVLGPDERFRFKTIYKYDGSGRLAEETQLTKENVVKLKLVYAYDAIGKQTGYSVFDGAGALLGKTTPKAGSAAAKPKSK